MNNRVKKLKNYKNKATSEEVGIENFQEPMKEEKLFHHRLTIFSNNKDLKIIKKDFCATL